jgi:hypothetical protein
LVFRKFGQKNPAARACVTCLFQCRHIQFSKNKFETPPKKSVAARRGEPSKLNAKRQPERKLRSE